MTVVIDVGCARYGGDYSLERLIEEFDPIMVYGFDPSDEIVASAGEDWERLNSDKLKYLTPSDCGVVLEQKAAWIYDGYIGFRSSGLGSWVTELRGAPQVECFDIATFIEKIVEQVPKEEIVLKIDAEGSEYDILRHLIDRGTDGNLALVWVEWHEPDRGRAKIEEEIACKIVEWNW